MGSQAIMGLHLQVQYEVTKKKIGLTNPQPNFSSTAPPLHQHCRPVPHRRTSDNGEQHSAASSPALQVGPALPDQFPMGRLPAQPQAVCRLCGEHLLSPPPSQLHPTRVRGSSLPVGPPQRGQPQDLAASSSSGINDAVAEGHPVERSIICT